MGKEGNMVDAVTSSSAMDVTQLQQKIQDFNDGKVNITKEDLKSYISEKKATGEKISSDVEDIIDSYENIDKDGDGISNSELTIYNAKKSILSSYSNQNLSLLNYLNDSSDSSSDDALTSLMTKYSTQNSSSSSDSTAYVNKLLESYSSSDSSTDTSSSMSLLDYFS